MFSENISVRFSDTDALGHVNNTMIPIWFEGARDPIFQWFMPELDLTQWSLILAKIDVSFHVQIFYGNAVEVKTYIARIGNSSFDVYQEIWQNDHKCASGTAVMVHFCYQTQGSLKIPGNVKQVMQQHFYQSDIELKN